MALVSYDKKTGSKNVVKLQEALSSGYGKKLMF